MTAEAKGLSKYAWAKAGAVFDAPSYPIGKQITERAFHHCVIVGAENRDAVLQAINPETGEPLSVLFYLNHLSFFDQAFVGKELVEHISHDRRVGHPLTDKFYRWRSWKYFPVASMMRSTIRVNEFEVFPVDTSGKTSRGHLEMIKGTSEILKQKGIVFVPPEGTRSPTSSLLEAKDGFGLLINKADIIVPIALCGTEKILHPSVPPWKLWEIDFHASSQLTYGKPLLVDDLRHKLPDDLNRKQKEAALQNTAMMYLALHLPENYWGVYADSIKQIPYYEQFTMENSVELVPFIVDVGVNRALAV